VVENITRLVVVESPFKGETPSEQEANIQYARLCLHDCLMRGEAPFASHLLYTQPTVLNDALPQERQHGIEAGFAWRYVAQATVVYTDRGISEGMQYGIDHAREIGQEIEFRTLPELRK
jgi:hypothetical protein